MNAPIPLHVDVDALANEIRRLDGNHTLGAAALAEALAPYIARLAAGQADLPQGGLGWTVRERHDDAGKLINCFVQAPQEPGMPYALEVLGDAYDYEGNGGIQRKLRHCQLIAGWANAPHALAEPTVDFLKAELAYRTEATITHQGQLLACSQAVADAFADLTSQIKGWQAIETAPTDDRFIAVLIDGTPQVWRATDFWECRDGSDDRGAWMVSEARRATHWAALPTKDSAKETPHGN